MSGNLHNISIVDLYCSGLEVLAPLPLVYEYGKLAMLDRHSELQQEQMIKILEEAQNDRILSFWITEVDHFAAHKKDHMSSDSKKQLDIQSALIREKLFYQEYNN